MEKELKTGLCLATSSQVGPYILVWFGGVCWVMAMAMYPQHHIRSYTSTSWVMMAVWPALHVQIDLRLISRDDQMPHNACL